jgi:purine-binding chemotaxis protein CheW
MVFWLGNEEYGISIDDIKEIYRLKEITINKIPKVPSFIEGIVNLRGDVVPIINLRKKFGMTDEISLPKRRIIIVDIRSMVVGLLVDKVSGTVSLKEEEILSAPVEWDNSNEYISRLGKTEDKVIFLLDAGRIIGL